MGASYNTILIPRVPIDVAMSAIADALNFLGHRVIHREGPSSSTVEFQFPSTNSIFIGPPNSSSWLPIVSCGQDFSVEFPDGYRLCPLSLALSRHFDPILYYYSHNSGQFAGYSIFRQGRQVEAQTVAWQPGLSLGEFAPPLPPPNTPSLLAHILRDPDFEFESFMRRFRLLEVGTAALAERLGVPVHLTDALDVQDGDGAIIVDNGEYRAVNLPGWMGLYYEPCVAKMQASL